MADETVNPSPPEAEWQRRLENESPAIREVVLRVWKRHRPPNLEADDLFQITIAELLKWQRDKSSVPDKLEAVAFTIATRRAIDWIRRSKRDDAQMHVVEPAAVDQPPDLEDEIQAAVTLALSRLEPREQDLLREKFLLGRSLREMAAEQGVSEQSIFTAIHRALLKARANLRELANRTPSLTEAFDDLWPDTGE